MSGVPYFTRTRRLLLGKRLGGGGEADVYTATGTNEAAKIYNSTADLREKEEKIAAMLALTPKDPAVSIGHVSLAWPKEALFDVNRHFCGYVMPRAENIGTLAIISNPQGRKISGIDFDARYLHRAASNMAGSVSAVHRIGHAIGDFNPNNVLITDRALITLIDTDSFQIVDSSGRIFKCGVGIDQYLAPERVHGGTITPEQDHFVMAVLIFQLLMGGFHPFDGGAVISMQSTAQLPVMQYLKQGIFPFVKNSQAAPPDGAPDFNLLRPELRDAFIRTFVTGHRSPSQRTRVGEWSNLLQRAENDLIQCRRDGDHLYYKSVGICIWCEQADRTSTIHVQKPLPRPPRPNPNPTTTRTPVAPPTPTRTAPHPALSVAQAINPAYVAVIAAVVLIGAISARRFVPAADNVAFDTALTAMPDSSVTYTSATDTMATDTAIATDTMITDTMATTTVAVSDPLATLSANFQDLRVFATQTLDVPPEVSNRQFNTRFARASTKYLAWQLDLRHNVPDVRTPFTIEMVYHKADGTEMARLTRESYVDAPWTSSWHVANLSQDFVDASSWPAGTYAVDVYTAGRLLGSRAFELYDYDFASLGASTTSLRVFRSGSTMTPRNDRVFSQRFDWRTLHNLGWQLDINNPEPGHRVNFVIETVYLRNGTEFDRRRRNSWVEPTWTNSYHHDMIDATSWKEGSYTIMAYVDGTLLASHDFEIYK